MTTILCTSSPDGVGERVHVEAVADIGVAAAVFVAGTHADTEADHGVYDELRERGVAVIVVNGRAPGLEHLPAVTTDDVEAGRLATEHLLRLGHRRIGLAAGQLRYMAASQRREGWAAAMAAAGLDADQGVVEEAYTISGGRRAGDVLLDRGVTGIVAASDVIALGVNTGIKAGRQRSRQMAASRESNDTNPLRIDVRVNGAIPDQAQGPLGILQWNIMPLLMPFSGQTVEQDKHGHAGPIEPLRALDPLLVDHHTLIAAPR